MWPTHYIPNQPKLEGTPPPRITLTTPPYPVQLWEEMTSSGAFEAVTPGIGAEEEMTASGAFVSGVMDDILVGFDGGRDDLEAESRFVSGVLNDILVGFNAGRDEIESEGRFISGALTDVPVVWYQNWPLGFEQEDLLSGGAFVSGVLA